MWENLGDRGLHDDDLASRSQAAQMSQLRIASDQVTSDAAAVACAGWRRRS
jgi:hypothetical protein